MRKAQSYKEENNRLKELTEEKRQQQHIERDEEAQGLAARLLN